MVRGARQLSAKPLGGGKMRIIWLPEPVEVSLAASCAPDEAGRRLASIVAPLSDYRRPLVGSAGPTLASLVVLPVTRRVRRRHSKLRSRIRTSRTNQAFVAGPSSSFAWPSDRRGVRRLAVNRLARVVCRVRSGSRRIDRCRRRSLGAPLAVRRTREPSRTPSRRGTRVARHLKARSVRWAARANP